MPDTSEADRTQHLAVGTVYREETAEGRRRRRELAPEAQEVTELSSAALRGVS